MQKTGRKKNIFEIRESEIRQIFPEKKKRILFFFGGGQCDQLKIAKSL